MESLELDQEEGEELGEDEEEYNVNNESSIFNLINSLERASNFNNRNYYNSITEDAEIQEAILIAPNLQLAHDKGSLKRL